ncbi:hypothetical protein GALL_487890 [mine drainage metagenome]|uniref:Uncharacterized protein n=1 Tax=mine drainage metagenome TaxID=410659 RepID=A0A1J5PFQ2_9ZZZZ
MDAEGQEKALAVTLKLRGGIQDAKVDIAARLVEIRQRLLVLIQTVGAVAVAAEDPGEQANLLGRHHLPQPPFREVVVADERQPVDIGRTAFLDVERQINTVISARDDLGRDDHTIPFGGLIGGGDRGGVRLGLRGRIDAPRLRFDDLGEVRRLDHRVPLEVDHVNQRVFLDLDDKLVARRLQHHGLEETRAVDALIGVVEVGIRHRLALGDSGIGQHRALLDMLQPHHLHGVEAVVGSICGAE